MKKKQFYWVLCGIILSLISHASYAEDKIKFDVKTNGGKELSTALQKLGNELQVSAQEAGTENQINYWEHEAEQLFAKKLRSLGYYENLIEVERYYTETEKEYTLFFEINVGNRYRVREIEFKFGSGSNQDIKMPSKELLKTKIGSYVDAKLIYEDEDIITSYIENNNCLLSLSVSHCALVDHLEDEVAVSFFIESGPSATVGQVDIQGLKTLKKPYVKKVASLQPGQCYRQSHVAHAREELQKSNQFLSVISNVPDEVDENGSVPVIFDVQERKSHSVKLGAGYDRDIGVNGVASWQHRNLFGSGENLKLNTKISEREHVFELNYARPYFIKDDQTLRIENKYETKTEESFRSKEGSLAAFIDKKITKSWQAGLGVQFTGIHEKTNKATLNNSGSTKKFYLISLPFYAEYDRRNNLLNATKGYLARAEIEPMTAIQLTSDPFLKMKLHLNGYQPIKQSAVLATKVSIGSILSRQRSNVPLTEKFLLGGSNSIRGYGYNLIGEGVEKDDVLGGESFFAFSTELRFKLKEHMGFVTFLDGGRTDSGKFTKLKGLLYGCGVGFRYYTDFAPLRFDIAIPLNRRKPLDRAFQLYFGIGHAF